MHELLCTSKMHEYGNQIIHELFTACADQQFIIQRDFQFIARRNKSILNWIVCDTPAMRMVRERGGTNNPAQLIDPSGYIYGVLWSCVVQSVRLIGTSQLTSTLWTAPDAARLTVCNLQLLFWCEWARRESECDNRKWTAITRGMSKINCRHLRSAVDVCENTPTQSGIRINVLAVGQERCERYPMLETVLRQQALATHCPTQALVFYF